MTQRQQQVFLELISGNSYKQIARSLSISIETVKFHCRNIYTEYEVENRTQLLSKMLGQTQLDSSFGPEEGKNFGGATGAINPALAPRYGSN